MFARLFWRFIATALLISAGLTFWSAPSSAQTTDPTSTDPTLEDPLHVFCFTGSTCTTIMNGAQTIIGISNPGATFGFTTSNAQATQTDFVIAILIPNNESVTSLAITENGGAPVPATCAVPLCGPPSWTTGKLDDYLAANDPAANLSGLSGASPNNPIGAYLPFTQANGDASATGYNIYVADLGAPSPFLGTTANTGPQLTINSTSPLPNGAFILAFLNAGTTTSPSWIATVNSGSLLFSTTLPEPATIALLLAGLLGIGLLCRPQRLSLRPQRC